MLPHAPGDSAPVLATDTGAIDTSQATLQAKSQATLQAKSQCTSRSERSRSAEPAPDRSLWRHRGFHGHVATQFFGAFNDNLFKQLILFLAARELFAGQDKQGIAFAVFSLPFVLFSSVGGDLSERFSKRAIIVWMKVAEVAIMTAGAATLYYRSWAGMLVVLFVMGTQSAVFGPSKYGVIPELVSERRLLSANGVVSMTTFMSIMFGQALAGPLLDRYGGQLWAAGVWCIAVAALGTMTSLMIPRLTAMRPGMPVRKNPFASVLASLRLLRSRPAIVRVLFVNALFWFNGGVVQQAIVGLGAPRYLDVPSGQTWRLSMLLVALATAIIVGSLCVSPLSRWVEPGKLVVAGTAGMLVLELALAAVVGAMGAASYGWCVALLTALGFCGAFFVVPVQTFLQHAPEPGTRGKTFAVNNFLNFSFIFLAGGFYFATTALRIAPAVSASIAAVLLFAAVVGLRKSVVQIRRLG